MINIIKGKYELKSSTKCMSCECKCKLDEKNVIQIKSGVTIKCKKHHICEKITFGIVLHVVARIENI